MGEKRIELLDVEDLNLFYILELFAFDPNLQFQWDVLKLFSLSYSFPLQWNITVEFLICHCDTDNFN